MERTILRGGTIHDGSGTDPYVADLLIEGDRIAAIGPTLPGSADRDFDVSGLAVAPGFIDSHAHDDYACLAEPAMLPKLSQGVTSVINGNCGLSLAGARFPGEVPEPFTLLGGSDAYRFAEFADYRSALAASPPAINVGSLIGHSSLRVRCMADLSREATRNEIEAMASLLDRAMTEGALGLSSGVFYRPGAAATIAELASLAQVVSLHGGIYAAHIRDEYDGIADALEEAFATAGSGNAPLLISHHKCAGVQNWGRSDETLSLIERANETQTVHVDCYPYDAGSTVIDPGLADGKVRIRINSSVPHPEMAGRFLADIARDWGVDEADAAARLMPGKALYFQIDEADMRAILAHPSSVVGSDGLPSDNRPHPRLWGTFPRVLGRYSRELELFDLPEAIAKMTGRTARIFGIPERGFLRPGYLADVTVFDPETVADRASYDDPVQPASGIAHVFVNGCLAWSGNGATGTRAGRLIEHLR